MLPYGVVVGYEHYTDGHIVTTKLNGIRGGLYYDADGQIPDNELKPYLRPMSSMTEEEYREFLNTQNIECGDGSHPKYEYTYKTFDWLNKNKFDYRGLISKGLALEASEGMYKKEKQ